MMVTFSLFFMIYLLLTPVSSFFRLHTLCEPCFSSQNATHPFCVKKWDGFARLMCIQHELSVYYPSKHELNPLLFQCENGQYSRVRPIDVCMCPYGIFSTRNVTNTTFEGVEIHFLYLISSF